MDFLVLEYVEGMTLSEKVSKGALPEKEIAKLGGQVAEALEEAHEQGVIHHDLKPANVMVTAKGRVKVLDFGLAKLLHVEGPDTSTMSDSSSTTVAGTLPFMSPEQLQSEPVDARVSPDLERIILKCLEKTPENRYQSAKEIEVDLRRL